MIAICKMIISSERGRELTIKEKMEVVWEQVVCDCICNIV